MIPPTLYYSRVGLELGKLVFRGQSMAPPYVFPGSSHIAISCNAPLGFTSLGLLLTLISSNVATFQSYFQPLINVAKNPASYKTLNFPSPQNFLARVRNASPKELALAGVTAAEVIGFFTVGEIIGRMNIVGYRGEVAHHH